MTNPRKSRPGGRTQAADGSSTAMKAPAPSLVSAAPEASAARRGWAYSLIRRASSPVPSYRSAEWLGLPEGDPAKVAAVVVAAECWATEGDELPERLALELENARAAFKLETDRDYVERYQSHRAEWARRTPRGKTFLERRTGQLESVKPRPGDYTGRGSA